MTSDFERKADPKPFGSTESTGSPADLTAGGTRSGVAGSGTTTGASQTGFGNNTSLLGTDAGTSPSDDTERAKSIVGREASSAKAEIGSAAEQVKSGAASLASAAREKAAEGVEAGKSQLTSSLGDFAAAVRKASDELGERDQSMAAGLVRQVANGLEDATGSISGKSVQDLTRSVAAFARAQPTTFLIGAALAGVALGRFARASGEHVASRTSSYPVADGRSRWDEDDIGDHALTPGRSAASRPVRPPVSAGTTSTTGASDWSGSYANPSRPAGTGVSSGTASSGSTASTSGGGGGPAPAEGPSGASLGHGSGSFDPQGGRDVR